MNRPNPVDTRTSPQQDQADPSLQARRAFLKQAGKFAAYTPPTVMLLMHPGRASIAASGGISPRPPTGSLTGTSGNSNPTQGHPTPDQSLTAMMRAITAAIRSLFTRA